ncbi:MAG: SpoIIE family protein phosphatase [Terracidiphilus sp.]
MIFRIFRAFVFLPLVGCAPFALAQAAAPDPGSANPRNVDATQFGDIVALGPNWLFTPGDDPAWASPVYDDSSWKTVSTEKPLTYYGYRDLHFAWYRIHVHLRPGTRNLTVGTMYIAGNFEVYANGVRLGGSGKMKERLLSEQESLVSYAVPDHQIGERGDLVLAIRCAVNWGSSGDHGASTPLSSESVYLLSRESAPLITSYVAAHLGGPELLLSILSLLAGVISFALYFALQSQQEYLAIGIYLLADSVMEALQLWLHVATFSFPVDVMEYVMVGVLTIALIEFVRLVLHLPRTRWLLAMEVVCSLVFLLTPLHTLGIISNTLNSVFFVPILVMKIVLPVLLIRGRLKGNREAGLLLGAILISALADYWYFLRNLAHYAHLYALLAYLPFNIPLGSYQISFYSVGDFFFDIFILIFLVQRTVRIARERNRVAAELEAARSTQELLLARSAQPTPGFHVETIYYPASEVGGDFFLVASLPNGGLLAIVGDVSGKGLLAAMRVAMILGVLRREDCREPAAVLHNLNEALFTQGESGFTTACCVQVEPDGRYTLANAGHITPYIDGREVPTPSSLPLGIAPDQHYASVTGSLSADQKIVLLSDGVVEARSSTGALLGFERLAQLTLKSAREIADTAKAYGQQDDITVLTLARTA